MHNPHEKRGSVTREWLLARGEQLRERLQRAEAAMQGSPDLWLNGNNHVSRYLAADASNELHCIRVLLRRATAAES